MHLIDWCARATFYRACLSVQGIGRPYDSMKMPLYRQQDLAMSEVPAHRGLSSNCFRLMTGCRSFITSNCLNHHDPYKLKTCGLHASIPSFPRAIFTRLLTFPSSNDRGSQQYGTPRIPFSCHIWSPAASFGSLHTLPFYRYRLISYTPIHNPPLSPQP